MPNPLFFQQLFEPETSTYTYLLVDLDAAEGIIIDSVAENRNRDLKLIEDLQIRLRYALETHVHADHITAAGPLADATGAQTAVSAAAKIECADLKLKDGDVLKFGRFEIRAITCPGHTSSCICYLIEGRLFSGDALLIRGTGRTDFQDGSAETLYRNIREKLFTLPDSTLVYPGHDYRGFTSSTIGLEKKFNPRVGEKVTLAEFVEIMKNLKLAPPVRINSAVPGNLKCGRG
jgi:glyoxylase-like metal-dependent hydrolase (beta-lactamase superfamily II)